MLESNLAWPYLDFLLDKMIQFLIAHPIVKNGEKGKRRNQNHVHVLIIEKKYCTYRLSCFAFYPTNEPSTWLICILFMLLYMILIFWMLHHMQCEINYNWLVGILALTCAPIMVVTQSPFAVLRRNLSFRTILND